MISFCQHCTRIHIHFANRGYIAELSRLLWRHARAFLLGGGGVCGGAPGSDAQLLATATRRLRALLSVCLSVCLLVSYGTVPYHGQAVLPPSTLQETSKGRIPILSSRSNQQIDTRQTRPPLRRLHTPSSAFPISTFPQPFEAFTVQKKVCDQSWRVAV